MKFLIIDTYYPSFLKDFSRKYPQIRDLSYEKEKKLLLAQRFGTSNYYSINLESLGHHAVDLIINDVELQFKWAKEHNLKVSQSALKAKIQALPLAYRILGQPEWMQEILLAQAKEYQPDVIYVHNLSIINPSYIKKLKKICKIIVGQIACPLPPKEFWQSYDLILTSFPHFVPLFRKNGVKSEYLKIAFEPSILKEVGKQNRVYETVFIGSFSYHHKRGTHILEDVSSQLPVDFWGIKPLIMSPFSSITRHFHGSVWGLEMYKILAQSKIVINRHISAAQDNANNMRLYESTGLGAMLITDAKKNLNDLFKIGKEVIAYNSNEDLVEKINYYLKHNEEREKIAQAGQMRTLREHNYQHRMQELLEILHQYI